MNRTTLRIFLQALPLLLPLTIYRIGDWLAVGLQWALFRYQVAVSYENSPAFFLPLNRELQYLTAGILTGKSALAVLVWTLAVVLLIAALSIVLYRPLSDGTATARRYVPHLTILGGVLFLVSCMLQYGISLYGVAGFAIPVGIPVILLTGYWTYRLDSEDEAEAAAGPAPVSDPGPGEP